MKSTTYYSERNYHDANYECLDRKATLGGEGWLRSGLKPLKIYTPSMLTKFCRFLMILSLRSGRKKLWHLKGAMCRRK
jgi:hypothetical protein